MGIQNGSKVSIHYKLTVDGKQIDSSEDKQPLNYTHGEGQIIPGLEKELEGLESGDKKTVTVVPEEGYGHHNPEAVQKVPRTAFAEPEKLQIGSIVRGQAGNQTFSAVVVEISDSDVTLDTNHPLAGKTLNFDIEVISVD